MDQNNYQQPVQQPAAAQPATLPFGIASLVLCCTLYGGIVGLILAIIGRKKGKAYIAQGGELTGASKVGFILCKVGLILSIVAIVVAIIYTIVLIATRAAYSNLLNEIASYN